MHALRGIIIQLVDTVRCVHVLVTSAVFINIGILFETMAKCYECQTLQVNNMKSN